MGTSTKDAIASLPPFDVFMTIVDFPAMEAKDIAKALVYQAKQYVPMPLSEVALDWMKVADYQDEKGFAHQKILLISVPQEQIKKYQRMFTAAGLRLRALEIESLSIARIFAGDPTATTIVDIGSRSTNIIFMEKGVLAWSAQSDIAACSLTPGARDEPGDQSDARGRAQEGAGDPRHRPELRVIHYHDAVFGCYS